MMKISDRTPADHQVYCKNTNRLHMWTVFESSGQRSAY